MLKRTSWAFLYLFRLGGLCRWWLLGSLGSFFYQKLPLHLKSDGWQKHMEIIGNCWNAAGAPVALTLIAGVRTCLRSSTCNIQDIKSMPFSFHRCWQEPRISDSVGSHGTSHKIFSVGSKVKGEPRLEPRPEGDLCESGRATLPWAHARFCRPACSSCRPKKHQVFPRPQVLLDGKWSEGNLKVSYWWWTSTFSPSLSNIFLSSRKGWHIVHVQEDKTPVLRDVSSRLSPPPLQSCRTAPKFGRKSCSKVLAKERQ